MRLSSIQPGLFEHVAQDVRYAFRSFHRAPLVALTIVTTVGLGLGLVVVVFTVLNAVIFRADDVRSPQELFAVERVRSADVEPATFSRQQYEALVRETDVFSDAFASTSDVTAWIEGSRREGRLVTGNFFHLLGVNAARGRTLTPLDDEPGRPQVIVLSHRAWSQHFASDPDVLQRTIRVNGVPFHVIGVTPEGFRGLEAVAAPDFWAPLSLLQRFGSAAGGEGFVGLRQDSVGLHIVGRLKPDVSRSEGLARLLVWDSRHATERSGEPPARKLVLEPKPGTVPLTSEAVLAFTPLFFSFGLILMIGCANVANLLLARGVARQREMGIRLAVGASRRRVIWQLLTESLLLASISAALAFGISRLVLAGVVYAVTITFPPDIGNLRLAVPAADWRVALFLLVGAMASTALFALAPAFHATRVEVVRAIRGEVIGNGPPGRVRDALVALQVTGSVLLLICAAVFLRSSWAAAAVEPGIRTAGIITVSILNEQKRGAILDAVKSEPLIASVAASWPGGLGALGGIAALARGTGGTSPVTSQFVSPEYFAVFGIDVVRGRGFTPFEQRADAAVAVVSESVAALLWPGIDAVGQVLHIEPNPFPPGGAEEPRKTDNPLRLARSAVVVGIARDVAGLRLGSMRLGGAGVYMPISAESATTTLATRVHGDSERARRALVDRLAAIDPAVGEVSTLRTIARAEVYLLAIPFWLTLALGTLALLLTLSGLFSVLTYLVEQRTREIGVRIALGATSRGVAALVLAQSARPVGIGLLLGGSLTAALGAVLRATPAAAQIGSSVRLFDPVAYAGGLMSIVAGCAVAALIPALRAARIDPVGALRQD